MDTLPRYEWHYLSKAEHLDANDPVARYHFRSGLVLVFSTLRDNHLVLRCDHPFPSGSIDEVPSYQTDRLNEVLHSSLSQQDGIMHALAAEILFKQQLRRGNVHGDVPLLEAVPPVQRSPFMQTLLAPSAGWMLWTWQLDTLLRSAGCTSALAHELMLAWRANYPRNRKLLSSLHIDGETVFDLIQSSNSWGGTLEHMAFPPHLLDFFSVKSNKMALNVNQNNTHQTPTDKPHIDAQAFLQAFKEAWAELYANKAKVIEHYAYSKAWTAFMFGNPRPEIGDIDSCKSHLLPLTALKLREKFGKHIEATRYEDYKVDMSLVGGERLFGETAGWGYASRVRVLIEHENNIETIREEFYNLIFRKAELKVLLFPMWNTKWNDRGGDKLLAETLRDFQRMRELAADVSDFLILIAQMDSGTNEISWRYCSDLGADLTPRELADT